MSDPFIGEIRMFAGSFAPRGWAFCNGQILATSQNDALFSLLGNSYGGNGRTTFGLPDMKGRIPIHSSTSHKPGQKGGSETATIAPNEIAAHNHGPIKASADSASSPSISNQLVARAPNDIYVEETANINMASESVSSHPGGGAEPHNNLMPTLCVNFIISLFGIYPSRS